MSDRRKQFRASFLAAIMVISMVGMGFAGFAGSAAASDPVDEAEGVFTSTIANSDEADVDHTFRLNVSGTDVDDADLNDTVITITYDEAVGFDDDDWEGFDWDEQLDANASITMYADGGEVGTDANLGANVQTDDGNELIIDLDSVTNVDQNNDLSGVDILTITLATDGTADLDNPSSGDVSVTLDEQGNGDHTYDNIDIALDEDAPVHAIDAVASSENYFHTLDSALDHADTNADTVVTVHEDVAVVDDPGGEVFSQPAQITDDNTTIKAAEGEDVTITIDHAETGALAGGDYYIQFDGDSDELALLDLTLIDVQGDLGGFGTLGAGDGTPTDAVVSGNEIEGFANDDELFTIDGSGDPGGNITFTDNVIETGDTTVLDATSNIDGDDDEFVDISDNEITFTDGQAGLALDLQEDTNAGDITIDENEITGDQSAGSAGIAFAGTGDHTNVDIDNSIIDSVDIGIDLANSNHDLVNITSVELINITDAGTDIGIQVNDVDANIVIDDLDISQSADATGIDVDDSSNVDVVDSVINNTETGIEIGDFADDFNVSSTTIDNSATEAIDLNDPADSGESVLRVNEGTSIDQASTGIAIDLSTETDGHAIVDDITVNGTTDEGTADDGAGIFVESLTNDDNVVSVTDTTFTENEEALNVSDDALAGDTEQVNIHFNTFEDNVYGVGVGDIDDASDHVVNVTFNDFVDNEEGLNVTEQTQNDEVNANFSWWGDTTGPNGSDTIEGAYGTGDEVTGDDGDLDVYPFLKHSVDDFSADQRDGEEWVVIEDPEHPIEDEDVGSQGAAVVFFEYDNAEATANNVTISPGSAVGERTPDSSSTDEVNPSSPIYFNVTDDDNVNFQAVSLADGISDSETTEQTVTGEYDFDASELAEDDGQTTIASGETLNVTLQLNDEDENAHERQGVVVDWTTQGASDAGVQLVNDRENTTNAGAATAQVETDELEPGEEFTVRAFATEDLDLFELTFTTEAGQPDSIDLFIDGDHADADEDGYTVNDTHELTANVTDEDGNALEGQEVTFTSNESVYDGADELTATTDEDGNATVDFTLPEEVGTTNLNATAGDAANETNVTSDAAPTHALSFATDTRALEIDGEDTVEIEIVDEFGNVNATGEHEDEEVTFSTDDVDVISIDGEESQTDELDADNAVEFTINAEDRGQAELTATHDELENVSDTWSVAEPSAVEITQTNATITEADTEDAPSANTTMFESQLVDEDGEPLEIEGIDLRLSRQDGDAAQRADGQARTVATNESGIATHNISAVEDEVGETEFRVRNLSAFEEPVAGFENTTTTDEPEEISLMPQNETVELNDDNETEIEVTVVDENGWTVPVYDTEIDLAVTGADAELDASSVDLERPGFNATVNVSSDEAGTATVLAEGDDMDVEGDVEVEFEEPPEEVADFQLSDLDAPEQVEQGDGYEVTVNVTNDGDADATQNVTYELHDADDNVTIELVEEDVELNASESTDVTFEIDSNETDELEGNYTHVVSSDDDEVTQDVEFVVDPEPQLSDYADEDGMVQPSGILDAIDDWRAGLIDPDFILDLIDAWRNEEPVA